MMNSYLLLQLKDLYKRYDKSDYGDRRPDEDSLINKRCPINMCFHKASVPT